MQTRRLSLGGGVAALIGLCLGTVTNDADAKRKRKRKRKNKKKRRKETTTADAKCQGLVEQGFSGQQAVAQTFVTLRSGELTRADIRLLQNAEGASVILEIRDVDEQNAPNNVLATTTIDNIPATAAEDSPRTIRADFADPANVVSGTRFALVVTGPEGLDFTVDTDPGNPCPDQTFFADFIGPQGFTPISGALVFETFVTARKRR